MSKPEPKRRWWRKKRMWVVSAAYLVSLPILYVLGGGPVIYAINMGWIAQDGFASEYLNIIARLPAPIDGPVWDYIYWWHELAISHRYPD